jgi:hypothetical protein
MNLVVTFAYGKNFLQSDGFVTFLRSFKKTFDLNNTDLIICTVKEPGQIWPEEGFGYKLHFTDPYYLNNICADRFFCFWSLLKDISSKYNRCLITDSRDVIFQKDAFEITNEAKLQFCAEGMKFKECNWNLNDQNHLQQNFRIRTREFSDEWVINGGVLFGNPEYIKYFCYSVWSSCNKIKGNPRDQSVIGNMLFDLQHDKDVFIHNPASSLFCLTGHYANSQSDFYKFRNNKFLNTKNELFHIVHQYDRLPEKDDVFDFYIKNQIKLLV